MLKEKDIDIDAKDNHNMSALMYATKYGFNNIANKLQDFKNLNAQNNTNDKQTVLKYFVQKLNALINKSV